MPQTFTITSIPTDTLKADAKGHTEAVYTVTNTTTRTVRGIARVIPLESTKQDWVKISGESDRDFGPNGTEQYVVKFDAPIAPPPSGGPKPAGSQPPGTSATSSPADKYGFQFGISLQSNPDEDHTEARPVIVELTTGAVPPPPKKFPIWIIFVIIAVVLVVAGIVLFLVLRPKSGTGEASPTPTPEASASPTPVPTATPIANFKLPTVANLPEEQAKQALNSACGTPPCVQIDVNRVGDPKVPAGVVVRSDPAEGNEIGVGSRVTLFVSKGSERVTLINVGNLLEDQARDKLEKACEPAPCVDIEINRIADNRFAAGRVIRTEPAAGTQVQTGSRVQMFISTGPISAPTPTSAALETICFNAVQNQIAWNYQGNKSWSPNNVQDLCRGASMPNPRAPAQCFQRVMHGGISWGGGTQWLWQNARDLCMGTADADRTISCFQRNLRDSMWAEAIRACKSR